MPANPTRPPPISQKPPLRACADRDNQNLEAAQKFPAVPKVSFCCKKQCAQGAGKDDAVGGKKEITFGEKAHDIDGRVLVSRCDVLDITNEPRRNRRAEKAKFSEATRPPSTDETFATRCNRRLLKKVAIGRQGKHPTKRLQNLIEEVRSLF